MLSLEDHSVSWRKTTHKLRAFCCHSFSFRQDNATQAITLSFKYCPITKKKYIFS